MIFTEEKTTEVKFPNITMHKRYRNGELCAYIASADEGYVMYDKTAENYEQESPESEPVRVNHYYSRVIFPLSTNFSDFHWEAVEKSNINEKHLF